MNQKKFLIILASVLTVGLLIVIITTFGESDTKDLKGSITQSPTIDNEEVDFETNNQQSKSSKPTAVELLKRALKNKDETLCQQIEGTKIRLKCFDGIKLAKALEAEDAKLCLGINDQATINYCQDQLLYLASINEHKYQDCEKIKSPEIKAKCLEREEDSKYLLATSNQDCLTITDSKTKSRCILDLNSSQEELTLEFCQQLEHQEIRTDCSNKFYYQEAQVNLSPEACNQIKDSNIKASCKETIVSNEQNAAAKTAINSGVAESCLSIVDPDLKQNCQDRANYQAMQINHDLGYCQDIIDQKLKKSCLDHRSKIEMYWYLKAQTSGKSSFCNEIATTELQSQCQQKLASVETSSN
jgi:hypothetical protein